MNGNKGFSARALALFAGSLLCFTAFATLASCTPVVSMGVEIEGEITTDDEWSSDSNDYMFYWDLYQFWGKADAVYEVTIESREGDPIHFELGELDIDLSSGSATATAQFITPETKFYECDVYLRSDFVGSGSSYRFTITEQ